MLIDDVVTADPLTNNVDFDTSTGQVTLKNYEIFILQTITTNLRIQIISTNGFVKSDDIPITYWNFVFQAALNDFCSNQTVTTDTTKIESLSLIYYNWTTSNETFFAPLQNESENTFKVADLGIFDSANCSIV